MPIKFAVKVVRLKVHMTIASPIPFIRGHSCVSNLTTTCNISDNMYAITFTFGMMVDIYMVYMLMLVLITLTLKHGHSGSTEANIQG